MTSIPRVAAVRYKDRRAAVHSPKWVPVSERMPTRKDADEDRHVWVYYPGPRRCVDVEHIAEFGSAITHWLPKPRQEPPAPPE